MQGLRHHFVETPHLFAIQPFSSVLCSLAFLLNPAHLADDTILRSLMSSSCLYHHLAIENGTHPAVLDTANTRSRRILESSNGLGLCYKTRISNLPLAPRIIVIADEIPDVSNSAGLEIGMLQEWKRFAGEWRAGDAQGGRSPTGAAPARHENHPQVNRFGNAHGIIDSGQSGTVLLAPVEPRVATSTKVCSPASIVRSKPMAVYWRVSPLRGSRGSQWGAAG
jgi:hypothetical protein